VIGVTASFFALSLIMVAARLLDRGLSATARLGWDDLLIGLSAVRFVSAVLCVRLPRFTAGRNLL
jgi:hypothetical protein